MTSSSSAPGVSSLDPVHLLWNTLYGTAAAFTHMVGLEPWQVAAAIGCVIGASVVCVFVASMFGKRGWTLDHE